MLTSHRFDSTISESPLSPSTQQLWYGGNIPPQQLVHYFNDRFENEHLPGYRPFILENGLVSGIFGPFRISSAFSPIRHANNLGALTGHIAQITVTPVDNYLQETQSSLSGTLLTDVIARPADFQSIINLDRLNRTVHMLNYLSLSQLGGTLFLDVDPRHVLGIEQNHGVYFEEIILKCGLQTKNITISLSINSFYASHHAQLLHGLNNYRQHGYQIALNIGSLFSTPGLQNLIDKAAPNYLRINAPDKQVNNFSPEAWLKTVKSLQQNQVTHDGQIIFERVTDREQANLVDSAKINLVQGDYYDKLETDHLRCL